MSGNQPSAAAAVVAYQAVTLTELRGLFDQVEFDLHDVLERELRVSDTLDSVESSSTRYAPVSRQWASSCQPKIPSRAQ